jgi:hypothetical protein
MMPKLTFNARYTNVKAAAKHIIAQLDTLAERSPPQFE